MNYYEQAKMSAIELNVSSRLGFVLGNAIKYLCRYKHKTPNDPTKDLFKAMNYLTSEIAIRTEAPRKNQIEEFAHLAADDELARSCIKYIGSYVSSGSIEFLIEARSLIKEEVIRINTEQE